MKENKKQIIETLTTKHLEAIKSEKLSNIYGGNVCTVMIDYP